MKSSLGMPGWLNWLSSGLDLMVMRLSPALGSMPSVEPTLKKKKSNLKDLYV